MLLAAEKKRLRQEFTSWLQPMEKHALLIDNTRSCIKEIVDCAIATFEALPDEKRFKYDLFGGKDSLAMSLAMRPLRDDAFYVSPVGGFAAQVDFIEKQIASFNALKQQLESELDLFDNSSTCVRSRRLIFSYPSDFFVSDERRAEARGRLKNELCYANRMLNDFSVSLHSALQARDAQINDIVLENKQISKNIKIIEMDYNNFNIKVWNRDGECKDLKGEKLKEAIAEILSIDEEENLNNDFSM